MSKADTAAAVRKFTDIPNVGPATERDFRTLGITSPAELADHDPYILCERLCKITGVRHDPCVIDVFLSVVAFMNGAQPLPWWHYTAERKQHAGS